jgi:glycosyltransferase XagB
VRHRLPPGVIAAAEQRALALGVGADRVLITQRAITEDAYVVALAAALRIPYECLEHVPRSACPLTDAQLVDTDKNGVLPLTIDGEVICVVAPQGLTARQLVTGPHPIAPERIRLTSARRLRQFVLRHGTAELAQRAADGLRTAQPELSAAAHGRGPNIGWVIAAAVLASVTMAFPRGVAVAISTALALTFLAWTALRMLGAATAWQRWRPARLPASELPLYTIIVALYDEAAAARALVAALRRLDYPPEKLDIKLVLEPDDASTRAALDSLRLGAPFEIVLAPEIGPRTKPKALNAALALARGTFTAVFDAEDRPAPDQLHRALDVFLAEGEATACVQARLTIDNTRDGWLARGIMAQTPPGIREGMGIGGIVRGTCGN